MRIGIAARGIEAGTSGVDMYMRDLLARLPHRDPSNQYTFFLSEPGAMAARGHADPSMEAGTGAWSQATMAPEVGLVESVVWPTRNRLLWDYVALPSLVRRHPVDLVFFPRGAVSLAIPCRKVVTIHDLAYFRPEVGAYPFLDTTYQRWALRRAIRSADAVISVSAFTKRDILDLFDVPPEKIHPVHEALPADFQPVTDPARLEAIRREYGLERPFIFFSGWVTPRKNLPRVLEAFARIRDRVPHDLVLTGGEGWGGWDLDQAVAEAGLTGRVRRLGHVTDEALRAMYSLADLTVYVSLYEGFGRPVLEAMTCGCPVLAADATSIPEVAGDAALLVDPTDTGAIADGMRHLLTDAALRDDLVARGRQQCGRFTVERMVDETVAVFNKLAPRGAMAACGHAPRVALAGGTGMAASGHGTRPRPGPAAIRSQPIPAGARSADPSVVAVVVNYNRPDDTLECIRSLQCQTHPLTGTVVVDNGSQDEAFRELSAGCLGYDNVRLIRSEENLHFARGNNLGIEYARELTPEYLLLLNNDAVAEPELVGKLLAVMQTHPEAGVAGPRICRYDRPSVIETDGFAGLLPFVQPLPIGAGGIDTEPAPDPHRIGYVTGCCMLVRTSVLDEIGAFEPEFISYYEDWDLNLRIQGAGHETWHVPGARIWHRGAATAGHQSPLQYYLTTRNRTLMAERHLPPVTRAILYWPATAALCGGMWLKQVLVGSPASARAILLGLARRPMPR